MQKINFDKEIEIPDINFGKIALVGCCLVFAAVLVLSAITIVPAGYNGVVFNWGEGVKEFPLRPGFHVIVPFVETVTLMETRTQLTEQEASAVSKDLQIVTTSVALNYRPVDDVTPMLYKEVGLSYSERLILPAIQESVKAVTARYTAEELIVLRPQVKEDIKSILISRLRERDILVDDISITNFKFSEQFDAAIEAKVTAEQNALKAQRDLDRIKIEKEQTITQAEAKADSIKLVADAEAYQLKVIREELEQNNELIAYKAIEAWDGVLPKFTGSSAVPFVDVSGIGN